MCKGLPDNTLDNSFHTMFGIFATTIVWKIHDCKRHIGDRTSLMFFTFFSNALSPQSDTNVLIEKILIHYFVSIDNI